MTDKNANKIGYKKTKLGWIPEDWEVVKLKNFAISLIGLTYRPENIVNKGLLVLRSSNIKNGKIVYNDNVFVNCLVPPKLLTQEDDILICVRNGSKNLVGKCAIVRKQDTNNSFGAFMSVIRSERNKYLYHFFQTDIARKQYLGTTSATINQITSKDLGLLNVVLPASYCEQKKIAEVLSCWDEGIEVLEKLLEKKQLLKKALMQRLLSRKLILCCSKTWKHSKFNSIFERIVRKNKELNKNILTISAQQGLISQKNFYNKRIASIDTSKYILLEFGEFAYNKSYSNGYPLGAIKRLELYQKGVVSSLYICFKLKDKNGCSDYWKYYFEAGMLNKEIKMIAQEGARNHGLLNMTTEDFFNILLYYPEDKNEQQKIAQVLNNCDEEIRLLGKKLEMLKQQKKGLMQKLLTGEIRVKI